MTDEVEYNELYGRFLNKLKNLKISHERATIRPIDWHDRMICLLGARGCGKTTFLLSYIKKNLPLDGTVLYVSMDDLFFSTHPLFGFAEDFVAKGGTYLFLDEVHKYPNWSLELKNIYDSLPDLKVVLTGSSILEIHKGEADLSRRVVRYDMAGLSFREFLVLETGITLAPLTLEEILTKHTELSLYVSEHCKPLALFGDYLKFGYYPFFLENRRTYQDKLATTVNLTLETDLLAIHPIEFANTIKLKKLLWFLCNTGPYKPDIVKLSGQIEVSRNTMLHFLTYLKEACLVHLLRDEDKGESVFTKPEKIYLHNTNLAYALGANTTDVGMLREVFFLNQVSSLHTVHHSKIGDFKVAGHYLFEVGSKNKGFDQLKNEADSYLAVDGIEHGFKNRIPLWMFGLLY